jgi:PEP-CTERM motif-containing protein
LLAVFALATSLAGFAQDPCNGPNLLYCQTWDGGSNLFASQNDNVNGNGNFATTYDHFLLGGNGEFSIESVHWVGGYFNPPNQGPITAWDVTFYNDNNGVPGSSFFSYITSTGVSETSLGMVNGFPIYLYDLNMRCFNGPCDVPVSGANYYWLSVVPDLGFPPQWGWATANVGNNGGYQCFFGTCGGTGTSFAFALDGKAIPEPGTLIMLGTGILGLAGTLRRKLL